MEKQSYSNIDIVITGNVAWNDNLAWDVKVLYGLIRGLTRNDAYCCYASNEYLGNLTNKSERTVRGFLNELEAAGAIIRDYTYRECENDGKIRRFRAIVPSDMYPQFLKKRDEMIDAKEASKKISSKGGKKLPPMGGEKLPPIENKVLPYKNNIINNIEVGINPQTPLQGGTQAATLIEPEKFEVLGKFGNVRLTESQKAAFRSEFGSELLSSLVEQLDAYIQSDKRRRRKFTKRNTDEFYATLRDWALRRRQPSAPTKVLIGNRDIERRQYSDEDLESLFTVLDETADNG